MKGFMKRTVDLARRHPVLTILLLAAPLLGVTLSSQEYTQMYNLRLIDNPNTTGQTEGNLRLGSGTPGQTLSNGDGYVTGLLEVDGVIYADGGVSGASIAADPFTGDNGETIANNVTDAVVTVTANDDAAELLDWQFTSSNASTADNDYLQLSFWIKDDNATPALREHAQIIAKATDVTSTTLDSTLAFGVQTNSNNGAVTNELTLSGAALYPTTDAGLDLGITSTNQFGNIYTDSLFVGDAGGRKLVFATGTCDMGTTATTITVTGTDTDDLAFANLATDCGGYIKSATPGSGNVVVELAGTLTTTPTLHLMVWQN